MDYWRLAQPFESLYFNSGKKMVKFNGWKWQIFNSTVIYYYYIISQSLSELTSILSNMELTRLG